MSIALIILLHFFNVQPTIFPLNTIECLLPCRDRHLDTYSLYMLAISYPFLFHVHVYAAMISLTKEYIEKIGNIL